MPGVVAVEHGGGAGVMGVLAGAVADSVVGCVEFFGGVIDSDDGYVVGQKRVEAAVEVVVGEARFRGETDHLAEGMDAGVGTAGGSETQRLLREALPSGFERALDGRLIRLDLPTGVGRAVVGDGDF